MNKIDMLSPEQESRIPEWMEKWVKIGLSTEPADFDKAIAAAKRAYSSCGLDQPLIILKVGSPYAAMINGTTSYEILKELLPTKTGGRPINSKVWSQIRDQIWDAVSSQVSSLVESPIMDQVSNTIGRYLSSGIGSQIGAQVRSQVRRQVNSQVSSQFMEQINSLVWDQVSSQVGSQVRKNIKSRVKEVGIAFINEGVSSMWCSYTSYFTFFRDVCGLYMPPDTVEKMNINEDLVTSCGGTWWHENIQTSLKKVK